MDAGTGEAMICTVCLTVRCSMHVAKPQPQKRADALHLQSGRYWLSHWRSAEFRLKAARSAKRSVRLRITHERRTTGFATPRKVLRNALVVAEEEVRLSINAVEKYRNSFSSCMRWLLEGK
ncbi:MAG: hypothetical protein WAV09_02980 [Minisyncoccia bacterium]